MTVTLHLLYLLKGHIWRAGYAEGLLKSHVYDDVPSAFKRWTSKGLKVRGALK
jgi:enolase-phosphatase E1